MSKRIRTGAAATSPDGTADPANPLTPTITYYQQLAEQTSKALDEIAAIIPKLEATHATTAPFVRTHLNVRTEFLATAIAAVEQVPELQGVNKLDVTAARDTLQFIEAFRPVQDKLTAFAKSLRFTMDSRKASLATDALQIYSIAKGVARDPGSADAASHVANLKRDLGRRGRGKGSTSTPPATPPSAPGGATPA